MPIFPTRQGTLSQGKKNGNLRKELFREPSLNTSNLNEVLKPLQNTSRVGNVLRGVFTKIPRFNSLVSPFDVSIAKATPQRKSANIQHGGGGGIEFFPKTESGSRFLSNPDVGTRNRLEVFDDNIFNSDHLLENAVILDLLHLLPFSPEFKPLISMFKKTFNPEQMDIFMGEAAANGRNLDEYLDSVIVPQFLRGAFNALPDKQLDELSGFAKSFRGKKRFPDIEELYTHDQREILGKIKQKLLGQTNGI